VRSGMPATWYAVRCLRTCVAAGAAMVLAGCFADGIGVDRVGPEASSEQLATNALSTGMPSPGTALVLRRNAMELRYEEDPAGVIRDLQHLVIATRDRNVAFAIAELAFLAAEEEGDRDLHLTSAYFSYVSLFEESLGADFDPLDPRIRLSCELYNRALAEALDDGTGALDVVPGTRKIPGADIELAVDLRAVQFDLKTLNRFLPAAEYKVHGIENRHRSYGFGVSVLATPPADLGSPSSTREAFSRPTCAAASLLLRFDGGLDAFATGALDGTLELYQAAIQKSVMIGERRVALEFDVTATIAYFMQRSRFLDFELPAFLGGNPDDEFAGMFSPMPYSPGRIPVVFVHGTNSSLPRFAGMINDLIADPLIQSRFHFWFFTYPSGLPVAMSALELRKSIDETRRRLDPHGLDPALDAIVVLGHSQGGLLCRHLVVEDPKGTLWNSIFARPIDELDLSPESRSLAAAIFDANPVPSVRRAIYISTPHLGSYQADRWYTRLFGGLVTLPAKVVTTGTELVTRNHDALQAGIAGNTPSALNGMRTNNPYLLALARLPVARGVAQHCICGIEGGEDPPEGGDGVVRYRSANLAGADSTFLVRDHHSCQSNPLVINEVRRILREHVTEYDRRATERAKAPTREPAASATP
jgi:pimeloyl-ACP methyl ester carboxylesterase